MAIPINKIKGNCCDAQLSSFTIICMDELDDIGSTCDKVIECTDKYILIEEKSILVGFLHSCCDELGKDFDSYKYINEGVEYLKITELITLIHSLDEGVKKVLLADKLVTFFSSSAKKSSNTTDILCRDYDNRKTSNMAIYYLYCNSGKPIDFIIHTWLSRYKNNIFLECQTLKEKLERECA